VNDGGRDRIHFAGKEHVMPKKQPGEDLEPKLKETLENMSNEELKAKVSEVALLRQSVLNEMKKDPEVKQMRESLAFYLKDNYKDDIKGADDQIAYITSLLEARGKA
jgi:hypothetical protein